MGRLSQSGYDAVMQYVTVNKNVQGGIPCFTGTRVPVVVLFDHLKKGYTIDEFLTDFPTVSRELAEGVLDLATDDVPRHAAVVGES
jgi:uncharacterized protein (DUF433 family)